MDRERSATRGNATAGGVAVPNELPAAAEAPNPRIGGRLRGGWRWPQHHESETLRRWLLRARAPAGCRAGVAVGGSVCIPRGDRQGAHSCGGAGWWGRHRGRQGSSRQVAPAPMGLSTLGFDPPPFPDRTARLLPSLLVATRTGLTPAGDDELMLVSATRYPLQLWAHARSGLACGRRFQAAVAGLGEVLEPLRSLGGADGYWRSNVIQRDYDLERRSR